MQIIGETIIHTTFGEGRVLGKNGHILTARFSSGEKKFHFPEAFEEHLNLKDQVKQKQIDEMVHELVNERNQNEYDRLEERRRFERIWSLKVKPDSQAAFGLVNNTRDEVFETWSISTGVYLGGSMRGVPRIPQKMQLNSACLLTWCPEKSPESERKIIGVFMVQDDFVGKQCTDGIIKSHEKYRLKLEEKEQCKFWPYFAADAAVERWGKIEIRYFSNKTMARMLKDIKNLGITQERRAFMDEFYRYFLKVNQMTEPEVRHHEVQTAN